MSQMRAEFLFATSQPLFLLAIPRVKLSISDGILNIYVRSRPKLSLSDSCGLGKFI